MNAEPIRAEIASASREWRSSLIDVGGSNRLLYFRPNASTIDLDEAPISAVQKLLAGTSVKLTELFTDPLKLKTAQRACAALSRKQREAMEEYGVSVAFLAVGLATWNPEANEAISAAAEDEVTLDGATATRPKYTHPSAPVLLRPIELTVRRGAQEVWEVRLEEDFQLNGVFAHVMNADKERLDDDAILIYDNSSNDGVTTMLGMVEDACSDVAEFRLDPKFFLGAFSYLKQPMVADVDNLDALNESDLIAALAGDPTAAARVRATAVEISENQPDYQPVDSEFLVLDADASQSFVVNAALSGRNMVVEGPPGTGKSQTIANVIASMTATGKRVLFVAQKRAAVEAVLKRLEAVELSHLVLDMFASTGSRRYVAEELRRVLDRQKATGIPNVDELHYRLSTARDRLVRHRDALHAATRGWGVSISELRALSAGIPEGARSDIRLPSSVFGSWSPPSLHHHSRALDELDGLGALRPTWSSTPGWSPKALTTAAFVSEQTNHVRTVASYMVQPFLDQTRELAESVGFAAPSSWAEVDRLLTYLSEVRSISSALPSLLDPDLEGSALEEMLIVTDRQYRKASTERPGWGARRAATKRVKNLAIKMPRAELHSWLLRARAAREAWRTDARPDSPEALLKVEALVADFRSQLSQIQAALQHIVLLEIPLADLASQLNRLGSQESRSRMPLAHDLEEQLLEAGLAPVVASLRSHYAAVKTLASTAGQLLEWIAIRSVLEDAESSVPDLAGTTGAELNAAVRTFQEADRSSLIANAARIRRLAAENLKVTLDSYPEEHSIFKTEVTRKRNFRAIRTLLREAPHVMLAAKPVWAMSPLQVSRMLPPYACFDVVIFDEASQVKPADAIPSLLRARQAIIAGDSRQLPPTDFFSKVLEDVPGATGDDIADVAESEAQYLAAVSAPLPQRRPSQSFTRDAESILFAMDRVLAGQSRRLLWHYRSRDERLIAVSNASVYDYSLTTFPAADTTDALRHVTVPWSKGIKDGSNSPEGEVTRVVDLVREHFAERPKESLGVITFGVAHQRRIEVALEDAARQDPQLWAALYGGSAEPFFIKSIERVQGDERDAIILTVGYGKGVDGKLRYFWGPLLQDGGERRLNVAISRARTRMTLVTSFTRDDVPDDANHSLGFKLMYIFLRFMASGGQELVGGPDRAMALNPFEIDIRDRLTAAGLHLDPQVGVGAYRIDFAVRHPRLPGRHVLAIEADGASYHSGDIARERDRLRQVLLEKRGWRFHRIWSTDWFNNPDREIKRVLEAVRDEVEAQDSLAESAAQPQPEPRDDWFIEKPSPQIPKPSYRPGHPITEYSPRLLLQLIRHYRSDGVLRTEDEELSLVMADLGFAKRGSRIVRAISDAQVQASR